MTPDQPPTQWTINEGGDIVYIGFDGCLLAAASVTGWGGDRHEAWDALVAAVRAANTLPALEAERDDLRLQVEVQTGMAARWFGALAGAKAERDALAHTLQQLTDALFRNRDNIGRTALVELTHLAGMVTRAEDTP